jgi:hypothetical protein
MIKQILKWSFKNFLTLFLVVIGIYFIQEEIRKPDLTTEDSIVFIEGRVIDYSFHESPRIKGPGNLYHYYIWLDEYISRFQVKADYTPFFDVTEFQRTVIKGDTIKLAIPKRHLQKLKKGDDVRVLSLSKNTIDYLRLNDTIQNENKQYMLYAGILFIGVGLFYYIKRLRREKED